MDSILDLLPQSFLRPARATIEMVTQLESTLGVSFPDDYKEFLLASNGGEGKIGSAYFLFWPVENIASRNLSAQITRYMSDKFIGVGTNGGGECYAFDYTTQSKEPQFVIVPLGDLDHSSKFIIADTFTEAIRKAKSGEFDDGEYNAVEVPVVSSEIKAIKLTNVRHKAESLWQKKKYGEYCDLMQQISSDWTEIEKRKVDMARKAIGKESAGGS